MTGDASGELLHIGWVDLGLIALLLLSAVVGLARGLAYEVMSVIGWVVAYVISQQLGPVLALHLSIGAAGSVLNTLAGLALAFVLVLALWSVVSWLVKKLVQASPLRPLDRVLGGAFGLLRGLVIALVVVTVVSMTSLATTDTWLMSHGAASLQRVLAELKPLLPEPIARHVHVLDAAVRKPRCGVFDAFLRETTPCAASSE